MVGGGCRRTLTVLPYDDRWTLRPRRRRSDEPINHRLHSSIMVEDVRVYVEVDKDVVAGQMPARVSRSGCGVGNWGLSGYVVGGEVAGAMRVAPAELGTALLRQALEARLRSWKGLAQTTSIGSLSRIQSCVVSGGHRSTIRSYPCFCSGQKRWTVNWMRRDRLSRWHSARG
jgi:hypothetical protein